MSTRVVFTCDRCKGRVEESLIDRRGDGSAYYRGRLDSQDCSIDQKYYFRTEQEIGGSGGPHLCLKCRGEIVVTGLRSLLERNMVIYGYTGTLSGAPRKP